MRERDTLGTGTQHHALAKEHCRKEKKIINFSACSNFYERTSPQASFFLVIINRSHRTTLPTFPPLEESSLLTEEEERLQDLISSSQGFPSFCQDDKNAHPSGESPFLSPCLAGIRESKEKVCALLEVWGSSVSSNPSQIPERAEVGR